MDSTAPLVRQQLRAGLGFGLLLTMLAFAAASKTVTHDSLDPDLFWHLRVAQRLESLPFPRPIVDDLSFASIRDPWTPYSWLAELGMKALWDAGGFRAAVAAQAVMAGAIVLFIGMTGLEMSISAHGERRELAAALAAFVGVFLALRYLSFRPATIAIALLSLAAWLLQRDRRCAEKSKSVWLVIPIALLLANIHLFVFFLPAAVFGLLIGAWWEKKLTDAETTWRLRRYAVLLLLSGLASLCTPMLGGMIQTALHYQFSDPMVAGPFIEEMQPFYRGGIGKIAALLVLSVIVAAVWNRRVLRIGEWMWLVGGCLVLLRFGRFAPIFAIFAAPTLAATMPRLSNALLTLAMVRIMLAALLIVIIIKTVLAFPRSDQTVSDWLNRPGLENASYPTAAADFVESHIEPRTHHLINEFTWGGYLEWRLGETYQVFIDGRTQVFPAELWKSLYLETPEQRKSVLSSIAADAAILPREHSVFRAQLLQLGWQPTYLDDQAEVLVPPKRSD